MSDYQKALEAARRIKDLVIGLSYVRRHPFGADLDAQNIAHDAKTVANLRSRSACRLPCPRGLQPFHNHALLGFSLHDRF